MHRNARGADVPAVAVITKQLEEPCQFQFGIGLELRSRGHLLSRVKGNPSLAGVKAVLHPYGEVVHAWSWRNWCRTRRHRALAVFTTPLTAPARDRIFKLPRCRRPKRRSRLTGQGTSRLDLKLPKEPGSEIPAQFPSKDVPILPSPSLIRVQNHWLAGNGRSVIDVYAGSRGDDSQTGMFVVYRTYSYFGVLTRDRWLFLAHGTGPARITAAPLGKKAADKAMRAKVRFKTKNGTTGTLDLDGDVITLDGG
jgi:hypothetical protein